MAAEITATVADADYAIWLNETWEPATVAFQQTATAYAKQVLYRPIPPRHFGG